MRTAATLAAAAVLAMAAVGIATAHNETFAVEVSVDSAVRTGPSTGDYDGDIRGKKACRKGRKVKLYHDSNPRFLIGTDNANSRGEWDISGPAPPDGDEVYAVVPRKSLAGGRGHRHKCKADRSPNVEFPTAR